MTKAKAQWNDQRMDSIISVLLRTGVILSSIVVLIGGIWHLAQSGGLAPNYRTFQGEPSNLNGFRGIIRGLFSWHGRNWIQFGLVMLVATPVARVAFSVFAFFEERDWLYVALTLFVLSVLMFSFIGR